MLLSIVIPAFNEANYLPNTLEKLRHALDQQKLVPSDVEIIVCDNDSTDDTANIAINHGAVVVHESIHQISKVRNTGAVVAAGKWLLFLDADSYPSALLLNDVVTLIEAENHIGCGAILQVEGGSRFSKLALEFLNPIFRGLNLCGGAFVVCEATAFRAVGGFSEAVFALEEVDFVWKLKRYGRQFNKKFTVLHQHPLITSGRKNDFTIRSILVLLISMFTAMLLFLCSYLLPQSWVKKLGNKTLGYWYNQRR